jgi:UDP-N-acetylglucosamine transferase subunit ALG13
MRRKRVLVAPMDWGLGHATRCMVVIDALRELDCDVFVAGSGSSLRLLRMEFPMLPFFELPGYDPVYPSSGSMVWKMLRQLPGFVSVIRQEKKQIESLVTEYGIDLVVSDNRYGCRSDHTHSVILTHQLNILMPRGMRWSGPIINAFNRSVLSGFDECWVPDLPGSMLTGRLSDSKMPNTRFIGLLSRFTGRSNPAHTYDIAVVLSGPEPQRSILEDKVLPQLEASGLRSLIVRGVMESNLRVTNGLVEKVDHLTSGELESMILLSAIIIARPGYSTIMDLARLGKKAVFIPTPGQTEQEYLANRLSRKGIAPFFTQDKFSLQEAVYKVKSFQGFGHYEQDVDLLSENLNAILRTGPVVSPGWREA